MKKLLLATLIFFVSLTTQAGVTDTKIPFIITNGSIIIQTPDKAGNMLNMLFDSGANTFMLSTEVIRKHNIKTKDEIPSLMPGGNIKALPFGKADIFKIEELNEMNTSGLAVDLDWLSKERGIRIDGLMGISSSDRARNFGIDFENHIITISKTSIDKSKYNNITTFDMVFSDAGFETDYSKILHVSTAVKVVFLLNNSNSQTANMIFDSGFNKSFALFTNLDIDSLTKSWDTPIKSTTSKRTNLVNHKQDLHAVELKALLISGKLKIEQPEVLITKEKDFIMKGPFGSANFYMLCGLDFMRSYKQVHLDYIQQQIHLIN
ncbi:aspartyl protease family protein [Sphingobacterium paucimobilis]|uniref:Peptidase A2 domain-containing protein n=1 Tax=Sphingobacterium paucimobilis HER1398 TaxID=1346330 RepID=U2J7H5_9SPHI|nr:aspartyl protease family protein [Sphingobacterium paucimobilis]ERJ60879.1 hypothetical protein M472_19170 [Sphingobacterium paucimobilis HER1398]